MTGLILDLDWQDPGEVSTPELAATWARLRIMVGTECLTVVEDSLANSYRKDIDVSAYPLAEWLAFNWWSITTPTAGRSWSPRNPSASERFNLTFAGDGFHWPDLSIVPEDNCFLVSQEATHLDIQRINYVRSGQYVLDFDETVATLETFVDRVVRRLEDEGVPQTRLQEEWERIQNADPEEVDFCRAAATVGVDPYDVPAETADSLIAISDDVDSISLLLEILSATGASEMREGAAWLSEAMVALRKVVQTTPAPGDLQRIAAKSSEHFGQKIDFSSQLAAREPWRLGWERARFVRELISGDETLALELDSLIATAHVSHGAAGAVEALIWTDPSNSSAILPESRGMNGRRFVQARTLYRSIFDSEVGAHILVNGSTVRDRIERAFAAELLAPADGISNLLRSDLSEAAVMRVAKRYKVNRTLIERQVENQILGTSFQ